MSDGGIEDDVWLKVMSTLSGFSLVLGRCLVREAKMAFDLHRNVTSIMLKFDAHNQQVTRISSNLSQTSAPREIPMVQKDILRTITKSPF